jgi:hypothetical protein
LDDGLRLERSESGRTARLCHDAGARNEAFDVAKSSWEAQA